MQVKFSPIAVTSETCPGSPLDGAKIVAAFDAKIPLVRQKSLIRIVEPERWNLFERWTARSLAKVGGFADAASVSRFLGVQEFFVRPAVDALIERGLVIADSSGLHAVSSLREQCEGELRDRERVQVIETYFEPISSQNIRLSSTSKKQLRKSKEKHSAIQLDEKDFINWLVDREGILEGVNVIGAFVEKEDCWTLPVQIIAYVEDSDSSWSWEARDPESGKSRMEFGVALEKGGIIDLCRKAVSKWATSEPQISEESNSNRWKPIREAFADSQAFESLDASEARKKAISLIRSAKEEVILFFPWIKHHAIVGIKEALQHALDQGAAVLIGYGIDTKSVTEQSHPKVLETLRRMRSNSGVPILTLRWLGGSHTKEMAVDRQHYLHGSHNILSYKPSPGEQDIRRESMHYFKDRAAFMPALSKLRDYFVMKMVDEATQAHASWAERWQAPLQLGVEPKQLQSILREARDQHIPLEKVFRLTLMGIEFLNDNKAVEATFRVLKENTMLYLETVKTIEARNNRVQILQSELNSMVCIHEQHRKETRTMLMTLIVPTA